jgi:hypothetical protein
MKKLITDWFTENDGTSWCIGRAMGFVAFGVASYKFIIAATADFIGFGTLTATIIAAVAAKNFSERK